MLIQARAAYTVTSRANGEIWLENRNGVIMRLSAAQAGLTLLDEPIRALHPPRNSGVRQAKAALPRPAGEHPQKHAVATDEVMVERRRRVQGGQPKQAVGQHLMNFPPLVQTRRGFEATPRFSLASP